MAAARLGGVPVESIDVAEGRVVRLAQRRVNLLVEHLLDQMVLKPVLPLLRAQKTVEALQAWIGANEGSDLMPAALDRLGQAFGRADRAGNEARRLRRELAAIEARAAIAGDFATPGRSGQQALATNGR